LAPRGQALVLEGVERELAGPMGVHDPVVPDVQQIDDAVRSSNDGHTWASVSATSRSSQQRSVPSVVPPGHRAALRARSLEPCAGEIENDPRATDGARAINQDHAMVPALF
jgi:hypothetical protein